MKLAGVSLRTASRVLNNDPTVRPETLAKVKQAMKQLNYQPDLTARSLRSARSFMIGVVYDNPNAYYIQDLLNGVLSSCREHGYGLQIIPCDSTSPELFKELRHNITYSGLAGLVLSPPLSEMNELIEQLLENDIKLAAITSGDGEAQTHLPTVFFDDFSAARSITNHLVTLGHKRIGFLWGDEHHQTSKSRHEGYLSALAENDIDIDRSLILEGLYTFDSGFRRGRELLALNEPPTAIIGSNDEIAAGTLAAAREKGLKIPNELSIAGFEDSPFSRQSWPQITTARLPTEDLARAATDLLVCELSPHPPRQQNVPFARVFSAQMIVRESTVAA